MKFTQWVRNFVAYTSQATLIGVVLAALLRPFSELSFWALFVGVQPGILLGYVILDAVSRRSVHPRGRGCVFERTILEEYTPEAVQEFLRHGGPSATGGGSPPDGAYAIYRCVEHAPTHPILTMCRSAIGWSASAQERILSASDVATIERTVSTAHEKAVTDADASSTLLGSTTSTLKLTDLVVFLNALPYQRRPHPRTWTSGGAAHASLRYQTELRYSGGMSSGERKRKRERKPRTVFSTVLAPKGAAS